MGKMTSLITMVLPLLLGVASVAQAKILPCTFAILECMTNKQGAFVVVAFDNNAGDVGDGNGQISIGDQCTKALDIIENDINPNFDIPDAWIQSGSQDRTVYTAVAGFCRP
jgi:hypothetical protein